MADDIITDETGALRDCLRETVRRVRLVAEFYPAVDSCEGNVDACAMAWNVLAASLADADRLLAVNAPQTAPFAGEG